MLPPSHDMVYQMLWLQLAADGRKEALLGAGSEHARMAPIPFMVGAKFPDVYLEFPLAGDPFLDVTALYSQIDPGTRVHSEAAPDTGRMLDWYAATVAEREDVNCGFELDTHEEALPRAARCQGVSHRRRAIKKPPNVEAESFLGAGDGIRTRE